MFYVYVPSRKQVVCIGSGLFHFGSPLTSFTSALRDSGINDYKTFTDRQELDAWLLGLGVSDKVDWKEL